MATPGGLDKPAISVPRADMEHQTIILTCAVAVGFYMSWSIGANDVANAMGTVVGARSLTLRQAVVVAGVMNVGGAVLVGGHVTATISKGLVDPDLFADRPEVLMLGMFAILIGAASWVTISTYFSIPVSTTHAIVGSVVGFGLVEVGPGHIQWGTILFIVASWFVSPILGGIISYIIFSFIKKFIFAAKHPFEAAKRISPFFVAMVFFMLTLMILYKGLKPLHLDLPIAYALPVACAAGVAAGFFGYLLVRNKEEKVEGRFSGVEGLIRPLQVISASAESFAHGANDVSNAIGPLAAIVLIVDTGSVAAEADVPIWILCLGGVGIMMGVTTWGHRVMETIGTKITEIKPSSGFAAEFGTATTVLLCSRLGLPVSTTHTSVGNVVGVGMARGMRALNLGILWTIIKAWVVTLPMAALFTIIIFLILKVLLV